MGAKPKARRSDCGGRAAGWSGFGEAVEAVGAVGGGVVVGAGAGEDAAEVGPGGQGVGGLQPVAGRCRIPIQTRQSGEQVPKGRLKRRGEDGADSRRYEAQGRSLRLPCQSEKFFSGGGGLGPFIETGGSGIGEGSRNIGPGIRSQSCGSLQPPLATRLSGIEVGTQTEIAGHHFQTQAGPYAGNIGNGGHQSGLFLDPIVFIRLT